MDILEKLKRKETQFDLAEIREAIESSSEETAIYIGCDSKTFSKRRQHFAAYVIAIVLHIDGKSGGKLYKQVTIERDFGNIRQRLMNEVYMAGAIALDVVESIGERPFEVHLDINTDPEHKSSVCVKEATGFIMGTLGITPKLKPEAFAASTISDKYAVSTAGKR